MTEIKKRKPSSPASRPGKSSKKKYPSFDDLVVGNSLPRVKVRLFPSRRKSKSKPNDQIVIELQCEV